MVKKLGISLRVEKIKKYEEKRDSLSHDWIDFFEKLDFLPILIPNKLHNAENFLNEIKIDGLVLSGGDNIGDDPERDITEKKLIDFAISKKIPILGVCRGMQVLNEYFGGKIIFNESNAHVTKNHFVEITDSKISKFTDSTRLKVNSFHHNQINIDILGKKLTSFAISNNDKTIEGFCHDDFPIVGVMWHPERDNSNPDQINLLKMIYSDRTW